MSCLIYLSHFSKYTYSPKLCHVHSKWQFWSLSWQKDVLISKHTMSYTNLTVWRKQSLLFLYWYFNHRMHSLSLRRNCNLKLWLLCVKLSSRNWRKMQAPKRFEYFQSEKKNNLQGHSMQYLYWLNTKMLSKLDVKKRNVFVIVFRVQKHNIYTIVKKRLSDNSWKRWG